MDILLLALVIIVGVSIFLARSRENGDSQNYPYQRSKYLLSKAERSFYGVLVQSIGDAGIVFAKVRVADVISTKKGLNSSDRQRAFNAISSKHFDFIVCDPSDCSIRLAVELDDSSHGSPKAQKRDNFLNAACQSAGVPILRIKAAKSYAIADLKHQLAVLTPVSAPAQEPPVHSDGAAMTKSPPESTATLGNRPSSSNELKAETTEAEGTKLSRQACPKCGEFMILRKAKSGVNAGQEFWGCSSFPKCRAAVRVRT